MAARVRMLDAAFLALVSALLLTACTGEGAGDRPLECTADVASIPMLVDLGWTAPDGATRSWAEYTTADGLTHRRDAEAASGEIAITLFGAGPEEIVEWTGRSIDEAGTQWSCSGTTTTGALESGVPTLVVTADNGDWDPDVNYFLGVFYEMADTVSRAFVVDRTGRYLWYAASDEGTVSVDVHLPRDGRGLLVNQFNRDVTIDESSIRRLDWDGEEVERTATPLAHHTFTELPDGSFAFNQLDPREVLDPNTGEEELWVGDAIGQVAPGGAATTVFSVWDWLEPVVNVYMDGVSLYGGLDWTHGNLISYDETTDHYLLSLAHAATIFEIDRRGMVPTRELGPPGYPFTDGSTPFTYQHGPVLEDADTLMVFSTPTEQSNSGAFEYALDRPTGALTELWHFQGNTRAFCLGQAIPLPSTSVLINYGCSATLQEVGRDGAVHWQLDSTAGSGFGQVIPLATPPWDSE